MWTCIDGGPFLFWFKKCRPLFFEQNWLAMLTGSTAAALTVLPLLEVNFAASTTDLAEVDGVSSTAIVCSLAWQSAAYL